MIADLAHLLWAVNLGCIGFHSWPVRAADPDHTDELRIDLDPQPGTTFPMAVEAAAEVKRLFDEVGIRPYIKTSGSRPARVRAAAPALGLLRSPNGCGRGRARAGTSPA